MTNNGGIEAGPVTTRKKGTNNFCIAADKLYCVTIRTAELSLVDRNAAY